MQLFSSPRERRSDDPRAHLAEGGGVERSPSLLSRFFETESNLMPYVAPRMCSQCRRVIPLGPCRTCQRSRDKARGTPADRGYDARHREWREAVLNRDRVCRMCHMEPSTVADHVLSIGKGGARLSHSVSSGYLAALNLKNISKFTSIPDVSKIFRSGQFLDRADHLRFCAPIRNDIKESYEMTLKESSRNEQQSRTNI
jgi:5-methylcytosine-specific restriction protein A